MTSVAEGDRAVEEDDAESEEKGRVEEYLASHGGPFFELQRIVFAFFAFPLLAFSKPLSELKEKSTQVLGAQATRYFRGVERSLSGRNLAVNDPAETAQPPVPDPSAQYVA